MECEEYGVNEYMSALRKKAYEKKIPFKGVFELTPRCNFDCNMCYVHLKPDEVTAIGRELTTSEWIDIAKEAQKAGTIELTLTGGEPFIRRDFRELYEKMHDMGFLIQIFTNGSLIDEKIVSWLKKRPPRSMRFTIYGGSNETYKKVCGIENGFDKVIHALELLKNSEIDIYLVSTITKDNEQDIGEIYQVAEKYHLPMIHTCDLVSPVRGAKAEAKKHQIDKIMPSPEIIKKIREHSSGRYPRERRTDFLSVCRNYRCGYWVTWSGNMQLCTFLSEPSAEVKQNGFIESWESLLKKLEMLRQPKECETCSYERYCDRCPGVLYAETGCNGVVSEEICKQAEFQYQLYGKPL